MPVELSKYDINFLPRGSIKSPVLVDFLVEFSSLVDKEVSHALVLSVDGSLNLKGTGVGVILDEPRYYNNI